MEWVETTARTVDEAKELLLDQLGVDETDTEFDVLEEPKPGLFGRTKGQARVRARVKPKTPPSRDDRRRRGKKEKSSDDQSTETASQAPAKAEPKSEPKPKSESRPAPKPAPADDAPAADRLDSGVAATEATAFLNGILEAFGTTADIAIETDESGDLSCTITGTGLGRLIGPRGGVVSAIEELTRTRLQHVASGGPTPRFKLDIGDYRATRRPNLEILVDQVIEQVRTTNKPHVLDVVLAGERKLVHDRINETASDLRTHSEGEDPVRRVVVSPGE